MVAHVPLRRKGRVGAGGGVGGECCAARCARVEEAGPGQALHGAEVGAAVMAPEGAQLACRGGEGDTWGVGEGNGERYDR